MNCNVLLIYNDLCIYKVLIISYFTFSFFNLLFLINKFNLRKNRPLILQKYASSVPKRTSLNSAYSCTTFGWLTDESTPLNLPTFQVLARFVVSLSYLCTTIMWLQGLWKSDAGHYFWAAEFATTDVNAIVGLSRSSRPEVFGEKRCS